MRKAVGIIPARWASTRFPGKPLYLIAGKPLLRHVWERCRLAGRLDAVIVATDDSRVADAAKSWGAEVALTSPKHHSGTDRVAEVARKSEDLDIIVNIQGDEPQIDPELIDQLVEKLRSDPKIAIVTAAHPFEDDSAAASPHQVKVVVDRHGVALDFFREPPSSRKDADRFTKDQTILRHQGIYGFRRDALLQFVEWKPTQSERAQSLEQLRALENGVKVHVLVTKHGSPGVDTPAEAKALERKLARANRSGVTP